MPDRARQGGGRPRESRRFWGWVAVSAALVGGAIAFWPGGTASGPEVLVPRRAKAAPVERTGAAATPRLGEHLAGRAEVVREAARAGAKVRGTVRWESGEAASGAEVTLLDARGEVLGEARVDEAGDYEIADATLAGAELQVTEPMGDAHQRDVAPLAPGEERRLDVVLGEQREVVGWVLDGAGEPQPGVVVSLTWEAANARWSAVTDAGGGFAFDDVPVTPMRVSADGGELGMASARLARSEATRREVTLVLEPVGTIEVRASPEVAALGEVVVRCFSATAHGEDGLWNDDVRATELGEELPYEERQPVELEGLEAPVDEVPSMDPSMEEVEAMLGNALRDWNQEDPEASLVRMALSLASANPMMEAAMTREMGAEFPELAGAPLEDIVRAAAAKALREEPELVDTMGMASLKVREGMSPMEAFMAADAEMRERHAPTPTEPADATAYGAEAGAPVEADVARPIDNEAAVEALEEPEATAADAEAYGPAGGEGYEVRDAFTARLEELTALTGIETVTGPEEARSQVASGRAFEPIPVRGAFEYQVSVRAADGFEVVCGTVFVAPGEEVVLGCGRGAGPAVLAGRVIDAAGEPVAGARIEVCADECVQATTDHHGGYELSLAVTSARLVSVVAQDATGTEWLAERRQQNARPGARTEVPDLVVRQVAERPVHALTEPFGGVGANIELVPEGIAIAGLFDDGPLALSGVEVGDVILRIGEEVGASLSVDDALVLLRGEVGSELDLTLRSSAGEVYDLLVTRGLVDPGGGGHAYEHE